MILFIEKQLQRVGFILDNHVLSNPKSFKFFCLFFDKTSKITNFLLFDKIGYPLFIFFFGFCINNLFTTIDSFILQIQIFGVSHMVSIFLNMPLSFQFFIFFFLLFYSIILSNTFLAYSTKIALFMKKSIIMKTFYVNFIIIQDYLQCLKAWSPAATAVCIFCGKDAISAYKVNNVVTSWENVAQSAIENGQTPPECP